MYGGINKNMSRLYWLALLYIGCFSFACKNDCKDVSCVHGTCVDHSCDCEAYYEGPDCNVESRYKFLGQNWRNTNFCGPNGSFWTARIEASPTNVGAVTILNLNQGSDTLSGEVRLDSIFIPQQTYGVQYLQGSGYFDQATVTIAYDLIQTGGQRTHCIALLSH